MEETERYGVGLEVETSNFKKQMQDIINTTKKTAETIKNNLNVSDAITFKDFEAKIGSYNKQIRDLTKELDSLLIKQRNDEWGGKNNTFNAEIEETKNKIEMLGNSIDKINTKKIEILNYDQTTQHISELEEKLRELKTNLEEKEKASIWSVEQGEIEALKESIRQTSVEIELAREHFNKLEDLNLQQPIEEANEELSKFSIFVAEIKNGMSDLGNKISQGFNKTIKNIKRMTLSLVGVHSAYFLISKAVSAYSQYDIEYAQKMKSAWASLGAFLAPLTSMLGTLMQKLVGYFNVFVKALTGVDYISKANEAYKYTKAIKDQTKALTSLDEITNISDNKEDEDFNPFEAIQNVELDPKWTKKIDELGKKLKPVYDIIKEIIDWSIKHPDAILKIIGGLVILSTISKILGFFSGMTGAVGLLGILGTLGAIVALGTIVLSIVLNANAIETIRKINDAYDKLVKIRTEGGFEENARQKNLNNPEDRQWYDDQQKKAKNIIKDMQGYRDDIENLRKKSLIPDIVFYGRLKESAELYKLSNEQMQDYISSMEELRKNGQLNETELADYYKILALYKDELEQTQTVSGNYDKTQVNMGKNAYILKNSYKDVSDKLEEYGNSTEKVGNKATKNMKKIKQETDKLPTNKTIKIKADIKDAVKMLGGLNQILASIKPNWAIGGFTNWINKLASYDVGTPYVPEDQIAMVHKGERIIPAKYNNENLFNNSGNDTTNALLVELIQAVEENGDKVPVFNINGREFAKATYLDYQNESNRLNQNTIIRRA